MTETIKISEKVLAYFADAACLETDYAEQLLREVYAQVLEDNSTEGGRRVLDERQRQVSKEGWTLEHDMQWEGGELVYAAVSYALVHCPGFDMFQKFTKDVAALLMQSVPDTWMWAKEWWKPSTPIRNLEKASALLAAEIDRLLALEKDQVNA